MCATAGPGDNSRCGPTAASTPTLSLPPAGKWDVRFSITIRQRASLRDLIEAIPEEGLDSHSLLDGRRRRCRRDDLQNPVPIS